MFLPGLPADGITDWAFYSPQQDTTTARGFKTWVKPAGCSWVYIFVQGAGGGGGNGFTAAAGAARGGGGGGGSGGSQRLFIPAWSLPDVLYLRPGSGGLAVAAGTQTFVAITPSNLTANLLVSLAGGSAGGTGTGAAAGAAGSAGAATAIQQLAFAALALSFAGNAGALGGAQTGAVGASVTPGAATTSATTGGAGGGGTPIANTDFAGGTIVAAGAWPAIAGGLAAGGVGRAGFAHQLRVAQYLARNIPPITSGGSGGGTNGAAGTGGAGGPAGWGSGGGGGGGGVTGGAGGAGGDGYIVIGAF